MSDMREDFKPRQLCRGVGVLMVAALASIMAGQQPGSRLPPANDNPVSQIFAVNCAACHGLDGSGTQRAPNIVRAAQKLSSADMLRIVSDGIPGTGMPGFRSLGEVRLKAVLEYLRDLQGKNNTVPFPGDPDRGKQMFFGEGGCSACHMVSGAGGFIAPDLTVYALTHSPERIKGAITDPATSDIKVTVMTVTTVGGERYRGIVRNEDNFSIQLQSMDGGFHFFDKSTLKRIDRDTALVMPSDYGSKLSAAQLNDLVSYLIRISNASQAAPTKENDEE
jgi:cytochrome c oxidase cbb3-type subunit III